MIYEFKLNEAMVNIIGKALGAQPYDAVAPVIAELQKQIKAAEAQQNVSPIQEQEAA